MQTWSLPLPLAWYSLCCLFSARCSHVHRRHHGRKNTRERWKKEREREGQHKGFSRQTNGRLDCSNTATGHSLSLLVSLTHTQAPLDQMTALELGGITLASLSPFCLFLPEQPARKTHTHIHTFSMLFHLNPTHTIHPGPDVAPSLAQTGLVCPP